MLVSFKTLGCKVNQYETEALKEQFEARGYDIVGENDLADIYIINTCTVTGLADRKSRQYVRRMKKGNPAAIVAVTGCYAQISPDEVSKIEGVNLVAGTNEKSRLPEYIESYIERQKKDLDSVNEEKGTDGSASPELSFNNTEQVCGEGSVTHKKTANATSQSLPTEVHVRAYEDLAEYDETGIITSMESRTRAYIKIQEGCNRFCSYCVIPYARGKVRSRNAEEIVKEAAALIANGFKEIILTGINTALYGMEDGFADTEVCVVGDGAGDSDCADCVGGGADDAGCVNDGIMTGVEIIIAKINALPGDFRIRLSSLEPTVVNASYVQHLFKYKKLCPHLHLSVQSGSDSVLRAMNRHYSREEYLEIVRVLKSFDAGYGITTDIIAGFPGESESDFEDSLSIVEEAGFCKVHAFTYSNRPGTKASGMKEQVSHAVKHDRVTRLTQAGEKAATAFFEANAGHVRRALLEEYDAATGMLGGYTDNYIRVYLPCEVEQAEQLQKDFVNLLLEKPYADGMLTSYMSRE